MFQEQIFKNLQIEVVGIFLPPPHQYKKGKGKETYIFIVYITSNITSDGLLVFLTMNQQLLEIIKIDLILNFKKENNFKLIS